MPSITSFFGEYRFLSNFYPSQIPNKIGQIYATVEHAFQAANTLVDSERDEIMFAKTPGDAKRLGRKVTLRPDWEQIKVEVMRRLLALKFAPGSKLADRLLATEDAELVESNNWGDVFWGVCKGKGTNWLGILLMERRAVLREEITKST